jgi:hypothetical protein
MGDGEGRHQRRDVPPAEAGRRRQTQVAARLHAAGRNARLGVLHIVDDALAVLEERRAFEGQGELASGAHQQLDAEPLLERVDAAADDGGRYTLRVGGRRQAALRRDGNEGFDLLETVHGGIGARMHTQPCVHALVPKWQCASD